MFGAAGALILASIDQVPEQLIGNAATLGVMALITALIFLVDLLTASHRRKSKKIPPKHNAAAATQTYELQQPIQPRHFSPMPNFATHSETKPVYRY
jgi:hypothetical protein